MAELISMNKALKYCGGRELVFWNILKIYVKQGEEYTRQLRTYYDAQDWPNLIIIAHAIKSTSLNIGSDQISGLAKDIELSLKAGNSEIALKNREKFLSLYQQVLQEAAVKLQQRKAPASKPAPNRAPSPTAKVPGSTSSSPTTAPPQTAPSLPARPEHPSSDTPKKVIAIVDDNVANLTLAQQFLSQDYRTIPLKSGKMLFKYLERAEPSIILLDIQMPEMDGWQVIEKLNENENYKKIPVIFLTADRSADTEEACFRMGGTDYISKPFVPTVLRERVKRTIEIDEYRKSLERKVQEQLRTLTLLQTNIIMTLANLIESRDGTTGGHIRRTTAYVAFLLKRLRNHPQYGPLITPEFESMVSQASILHDIGKISVSDIILQKAGKLTDEEYTKMKCHSAEGSRLIQENLSKFADSQFVNVASELARHHHEKWDGSGYPDHLSGDTIPLSARILAVADVFDALVSKRQYKEGLPFDTAKAVLIQGRETFFEPTLVDIFLDRPEELQQLMQNLNKAE